MIASVGQPSGTTHRRQVVLAGLLSMRRQFLGRPVGGLLAGAQGAFAGEAVEIVATQVKREIPSREAVAQGGHFAQSPGAKLGDADIPSYEMHKEHLAAALREGPLHNFACLLVDGFIVGVQTTTMNPSSDKQAKLWSGPSRNAAARCFS